MEINENAFVGTAQFLHNLFPDPERIINCRQKGAALQIHNGQLFAVAFNHRIPSARGSRRKIGRSDHPRLIVDKFKNILIVPSMITQCNTMYTPIKKFIGNCRGNPSACGGIFTVNDDNMRLVLAL
ncbi:hypothetical protein D3C80_1658400 [compost metagenome]